MLNPRYPAAVVAGNVETSQCLTDTLYGALGVMGASQGTMNKSPSATKSDRRGRVKLSERDDAWLLLLPQSVLRQARSSLPALALLER